MRYEAARQRFEREYWRELFIAHRGCVIDMARDAGLNRTHVYKILKRYGITNPVRRRLRGNWHGLADRPSVY